MSAVRHVLEAAAPGSSRWGGLDGGANYSGVRRGLPCGELDGLPCMDIVDLLPSAWRRLDPASWTPPLCPHAVCGATD
ncbi:hypothetical protein [Streptomyces sp. ALI-76-A]|uniref:hypothetical protein n=1 Tax=Streptomyces sp. ALI-76-A TaxID=3025736 RepID=UPI00256F13FF|nr:hypothetical protein [Streptomyces sp. ALI-76-A]MDL5202570.1 hypothetical protein [Streptomyces sp. ALI-76-A]